MCVVEVVGKIGEERRPPEPAEAIPAADNVEEETGLCYAHLGAMDPEQVL